MFWSPTEGFISCYHPEGEVGMSCGSLNKRWRVFMQTEGEVAYSNAIRRVRFTCLAVILRWVKKQHC